MSRILKNIAALALMVGALIGSVGTSDAQNYRSYNNPPGPAYHGATVLTALWRLCLLAAALTQTRLIITKGAFNHPRPSSTGGVLINWSPVAAYHPFCLATIGWHGWGSRRVRRWAATTVGVSRCPSMAFRPWSPGPVVGSRIGANRADQFVNKSFRLFSTSDDAKLLRLA